MNRSIAVPAGCRSGCVRIPASKSQAHRLLICAALGERETEVVCDGISKDIAATMQCMTALGASFTETQKGRFRVTPIGRLRTREHSGAASAPADRAELYCGESGSTLRFLLPVAGALGANAVFHMEGRLPERPIAPLDRELLRGGMEIVRQGDLLFCGGRLASGDFSLPGDVSSQYISGLLLAMPLLEAGSTSTLTVTGSVESAGYIAMTEEALRLSGVAFRKEKNRYEIDGGQTYALPDPCAVEGDYSNAAFFLCAGAFSQEGIRVEGLREGSAQGDRAVCDVLARFGADVKKEENAVCVRNCGALHGCTVDASQVPDLIPVLAVTAAGAEGETRIVNAGRLRLKESDRLTSTAEMLRALGADVTEQPEGLVIRGKARLAGGTVNACNDHRIAMAAATAACICEAPVTVSDADCVQKSYPAFWDDFAALSIGGRRGKLQNFDEDKTGGGAKGEKR